MVDATGGAWSNQGAGRLGHYAGGGLIASIVAAVAIGLHPLPGPYAYSTPLLLFALVLLFWLMMRVHDRSLCEHCASSIPLNPAETAKRQRNRFWMAHTGSEPRFLVPYLVVLIGSNFMATTPTGRYAWAAVQLSMIYLILAQSTHRRLQPWCPVCSEGGGGQEREDTPPPWVPTDGRRVS